MLLNPPELNAIDVASIAFGAVLLGHALQISNGFLQPIALAWVALAAAFVIAGVARVFSCFGHEHGSESLVSAVLVAGLLSNFLALATSPVGLYLADPEPARHPALLAALTVATTATLLIAFDRPRRRTLWFPLLLLTYAAIGVWLILESPRPHIDVMTVFRAALNALRRLHSPYSITFRNIYPNDSLYGEGLVVNGRVQFGFPYPPLSLLMALPAQALGLDVRYAELAALVVGAAWIGYSARGRIAPLAAGLLLFTPRTLFVLEQAWTESLAVCWLGLTMFASAGANRAPGDASRPAARAIALGLLVAVKQHLVIALLLVRWLRGSGENGGTTARMLLIACGVAAAVTLPFFIWDPQGVWRSVVMLQFKEPFRRDSLSVLSYLAGRHDPDPAVLLVAPLLGIAAALALTWRSLPRTPAGFALGLGTAFLLMFMFSKKAFCNYYFLVIALLAAGVASAGARFPERDR